MAPGHSQLRDAPPYLSVKSATEAIVALPLTFHSFIFSDTIANNIALSTDDVDVERMLHAASRAHIDDFIATQPLGYNTRIGMEGNGISAGQRQRSLLARAVYKDPEYISSSTKQPIRLMLPTSVSSWTTFVATIVERWLW